MNASFSLRLADNRLVALPKPALMGIVNVSPNSFFNPHLTVDSALYAVEAMVAAGVHIVDIGGEATNPGVALGAGLHDPQQEEARVIPVVAAVRDRFDVLISVDTSQVGVMRAAVAAGGHLINDQRALAASGALAAVAEMGVPVCLMHFFNPMRTPGSSSLPALMAQIRQELLARVEACQAAGIASDRIILDPGFGQGNYGKNAAENFYLLAQLQELTALGYPVLSGWSRKSMLGEALGGAPPAERLMATVAVDSLATFLGAHILRGHDVPAMRDAVAVACRVRDAVA